MKPRVVYIAHPISGDVEENLRLVAIWYRWAWKQGVIPFAPYFLCCHALKDDNEFERLDGQLMDQYLFTRIKPDEIWLCGEDITSGMEDELELAIKMGILYVNYTGSKYPPGYVDDSEAQGS